MFPGACGITQYAEFMSFFSSFGRHVVAFDRGWVAEMAHIFLHSLSFVYYVKVVVICHSCRSRMAVELSHSLAWLSTWRLNFLAVPPLYAALPVLVFRAQHTQPYDPCPWVCSHFRGSSHFPVCSPIAIRNWDPLGSFSLCTQRTPC